MRLDHLLSKEHFTASLRGVVQSRAQDMTVIQFRMAASFWGGARGWNADQFGRQLLLLLVRRHLAVAWGTGWGEWVGCRHAVGS